MGPDNMFEYTIPVYFDECRRPIHTYPLPTITVTKSEEECKNMKNPEEKKEVNSIHINRSDNVDRVNVPLSQLEVTDTFRIVDDRERNVYVVVDLKDVIDISTTDPTTVHAINMHTAEVMAFDDTTRVYVYSPSGVSFRVGSFIEEEVR